MNKKIISYLKEIDEDTYIPPSYFPPLKAKNSYADSGVNLDRKKLLMDIEKEVSKCKKCPLGLTRLKAVFGMGNPYSKVMFIGEGPGWEEDHQGLPFVGKAGHLLDKILAAIGLNRGVVYITNIVKCHPMINPQTPQARGNDRPPTSDEIFACSHYLHEQIKVIRPACVVTLGNTATRFFIPHAKGVSQVRGRFHTIDGFIEDLKLAILPTYHPAALLRNPSLKKDTWQDMKSLRDFLKDLK